MLFDMDATEHGDDDLVGVGVAEWDATRRRWRAKVVFDDLVQVSDLDAEDRALFLAERSRA